MSLERNFVNEINEILMKRRGPDDNVEPFTLHIPEHKFKKNAEKFNYALNTVYDRYKDKDVKLFHIILSLQEFFEMDLLVQHILEPKLKRLVKKELEEEYHIKSSNRRASNAQKKSD